MSNTILEDKMDKAGYDPSQILFYLLGAMNKEPNFGAWLRPRRKAKGFTQQELAERANNVCSAGYISALERGIKSKKRGKPVKPDEAVVEALAVALEESINDARLAAGYSPLPEKEKAALPPLSPQAGEIIMAIEKLDPEARIRLLAALVALYPSHFHQPAQQPIVLEDGRVLIPPIIVEPASPEEIEQLKAEGKLEP